MPTTDSPLRSTSAPTLRLEEFRQLRATIRERGTARALVSVITFVSWAALVVASAPASLTPLIALVPLLVLAGGFEVVFALHIGAERIGRYLYVFYERDAPMAETPKWETAIASFGQTPAAALRATALTEATFIAAALTNLLAALGAFTVPAGTPLSLAALAGPLANLAALALHALFIARVLGAVRQARRQRERDTAAFAEIAKQLAN